MEPSNNDDWRQSASTRQSTTEGSPVTALRIEVAINTCATLYRWQIERFALCQTKIIGNRMACERKGDV